MNLRVQARRIALLRYSRLAFTKTRARVTRKNSPDWTRKERVEHAPGKFRRRRAPCAFRKHLQPSVHQRFVLVRQKNHMGIFLFLTLMTSSMNVASLSKISTPGEVTSPCINNGIPTSAIAWRYRHTHGAHSIIAMVSVPCPLQRLTYAQPSLLAVIAAIAYVPGVKPSQRKIAGKHHRYVMLLKRCCTHIYFHPHLHGWAHLGQIRNA